MSYKEYNGPECIITQCAVCVEPMSKSFVNIAFVEHCGILDEGGQGSYIHIRVHTKMTPFSGLWLKTCLLRAEYCVN